jgi:predicted nucleic acid-binding protein
MFVLNTNVISEVMREFPNPAVAAWLRACPADAMFTTAISHGELLYGVRRLPQGVRRHRLERAVQTMFARAFEDRVLPFDSAAADAYADLRIMRARTGRPRRGRHDRRHRQGPRGGSGHT